MKIVGIDNFNRDNVSDILIAENVKEFYAKAITKFLNDNFCSKRSDTFFVTKEDDYKLFIWEP